MDVQRVSLCQGASVSRRQSVTSTVIAAELATCCWFPLLLVLVLVCLPLTGAPCQAENNGDSLAPTVTGTKYDANSSAGIGDMTSMAAATDDVIIAFLINYTAAASRRHRAIDVCSLFEAMEWTTADVNSESVSAIHAEYILKTIHAVCLDELIGAREAVECLEREMSSIPWRSCQRRLTFNVRQRTHPYCYFAQEAADCKMALVTSSCGDDAAKLAYHMTALITSASPGTCSIRPLTDDYTGFRYDANCPAYFVDDMELCAIKHLYSQRGLLFRPDNDLVAIATDFASITNACRTFREYKLCVRPIKKACRRGVRLVYEQQSAIRRYRLKMDFICSKSYQQQYVARLGCYQRVLESANKATSLRHCDRYWESHVKPSLRHVTAYRFYCDITANVTISVRRKLGRLTTCYERAFTERCGSVAGRLMASFMGRAFADPHYPRYRYRPNCALHGRRLPVRQPSPSPVIDADLLCSDRSARRNPHAAAVTFVVIVASVAATRPISC